MKSMKTILIPLLLLPLLIACGNGEDPLTPEEVEALIDARVDARVAEELAKMQANGGAGLMPQEIAQRALKSTVYLIVKKWDKNYYSSGFVIQKGLIATCAHNLDGMISGTAEIVLTGNRKQLGHVLFE